MGSRKIKAVGKHKIKIQNVKLSSFGEKDMLVRSLYSGISHGTELAVVNKTTPTFYKHWINELRCFIDDDRPSKEYPVSLGYENVVEVLNVGKAVKEVKKGDLLWIDNPHQTLSVINIDDTLWYKLPSKKAAKKAVFLALTRVALAAVHDARPKIGDNAFVSGLGTVGLIIIQLLRLAGVKNIIASDPIIIRREKAKEYGVTIVDPNEKDAGFFAKRKLSRGADFAIECSGSIRALHSAIKSCAVAGTVVTVATYRSGASDLCLGEEWHRNRITLISSMSVNGCPHRDYPLWDLNRLNKIAIDLLITNKISVLDLISHTYPFERAIDAYKLLQEKPEETIKVILTYK